jgi:hypothetical protein
MAIQVVLSEHTNIVINYFCVLYWKLNTIYFIYITQLYVFIPCLFPISCQGPKKKLLDSNVLQAYQT